MLLIVVTAASVAAEPESPSASSWITGSMTGSWWSGSRGLNDRKDLPGAALGLKAEPKSADVSLVVDGWIRNEDLSDNGATKSKLREGYVGISGKLADVRVGRQILVWGRADQLNPTDNLTPRDFTLLVPDTADDRLGADAVLFAHRRGEYALSAIWLPHFRPNIVPLPGGVSVRKQIPGSADQWAIKFDRSGGQGVDWSLSSFSGFDLNPTLGVDPNATNGGLLERHPRIRVTGGDFAIPVGRFGLRGEAAYTSTEDHDGTDPLKKKPFYFGVFGVERTFFDYLNINVQYYVYAVQHYLDPRQVVDPGLRQLAVSQAIVNHQLGRSDQGIAIRIADKWWNETLEGEVAALASFDRRDFALKPKVTYAFNDRLKGTLSADILRGSQDAFFGRFQRNSVVYSELRYSW
jgi:hypothetical protein